MPPPLPDHVTLQEVAKLMDLPPQQVRRLITACQLKITHRAGQMEIHERHALALLRCQLKYDWDMTLKTLRLPPRAFPLPVKPFHSERYSKLLAQTWRRRHAKILTTFMTSSVKPSKKKTSSSTSWRRGRRSKSKGNSSNSRSVARSISILQ